MLFVVVVLLLPTPSDTSAFYIEFISIWSSPLMTLNAKSTMVGEERSIKTDVYPNPANPAPPSLSHLLTCQRLFVCCAVPQRGHTSVALRYTTASIVVSRFVPLRQAEFSIVQLSQWMSVMSGQ